MSKSKMNKQTGLPKHQQLLYSYLQEVQQTKGLHLIDVATGGGKTFVCLKYWCEEGHKHFKRLFYVLPQHKNIDSAIADFNTSNAQTGNQLRYIHIKSANAIAEFLQGNDSHKTLFELSVQLERLLTRVSKRTPKQTDSLIQCYNKIKDNIDTLYGYCQSNLQPATVDQAEKVASMLKGNIHTYLKATLPLHDDPEEESDFQENTQLVLKHVPALKEVFPAVAIHQCQTIFITAAKGQYVIDPIVNPKIYFYNSSFVENNLIIYDESDKDYQSIRDNLFHPMHEDKPKDILYLLFELQQSLATAKTHMVKMPGFEDCYTKWQEKVNQYTQQVDTLYQKHLIPICRKLYFDSHDKARPFVFRSAVSGIVLPQQVSKYRLASNTDRNCLELVCEPIPPKESTETPAKSATNPTNDQPSLQQAIREILRLLRRFSQDLGNSSDEYYMRKLQNLLKHTKDDTNLILPSPEALDDEILDQFQITRKGRQELYAYISTILRMRRNKMFVPRVEDDLSVFNTGSYQIMLNRELPGQDNYYSINWSEIRYTPERCIHSLIRHRNNTVIFLSATARIACCYTNFCLEYLQNLLGDDYHTLSPEWTRAFDEAIQETLPTKEERPVQCSILPKLVLPKEKDENPFLPNNYDYPDFKALFAPEQWEEAKQKISALHNKLKSQNRYVSGKIVCFDEEKIAFYMKRYYHYLFVVRQLIDTPNAYSAIYFCNNLPRPENLLWHEGYLTELSALVSGPEHTNPLLILRTHNFHAQMEKFREEVGKGHKRILLSAYNTTSVGMNLVYVAPPEQQLTGKAPDYWVHNPIKSREKDIDIIGCQDVSNYLFQQSLVPDQDNGPSLDPITGIYLALVLNYTGQFSTERANRIIQALCTNSFWPLRKKDPDIHLDYLRFKLAVLKQAVGRVCRRTVKGTSTQIYIEEELVEAIRIAPEEHSYGVEFRALMDYISGIPQTQEEIDFWAEQKEQEQIYRANNIQNEYRSCLNRALKYYHATDTPEEIDPETRIAQEELEQMRSIILKHPTREMLPADGIGRRCYVRFDEPLTSYAYQAGKRGLDGDIVKLSERKSAQATCMVDEQKTNLPVLMRSEIIRRHFQANHIPTYWKPGKYILPPYLMLNVYKGCVGEEALKAILLHLFRDDTFVPYKGGLFELADLHSCRRQIAFDAKNYHPAAYYEEHNDVRQKMEEKAEKLGCPVLFIRLLSGENSERIERIGNHIYAIPGLIDSETGELIQPVVDFLRRLYQEAHIVEQKQSTPIQNEEAL